MSKIKLPLIIIAALFLGFFVFNTYIKKSSPDGIVNTPAEVATSLDENILPLLQKLNNITFDASIFDDKIFKTLEDQSKQVEPEEKGRENPFAPTFGTPLGGTSATGPTFGTGAR